MGPTDKEIKVSALQRLVKDRKYYLKELFEQKEAVLAKEDKIKSEKLADDSNDAYELKNLKRIVTETEKLIPNLTSKIENVIKDIEESFESLDDSTLEIIEKSKEDIK